ncbi:MAG: gliding motility-associated C-terminal domain-containing protein [Saprospiraceae bacterium]|nr:gliding motility-associated C-terminal domain-containing protein [Saprospiraceae bacterium]
MLHFLLICLNHILLVNALPEMTKQHSHFQMAEICDNAKDDDADGLIDLNDSDCDCQRIEPISLIPNPSFEILNCCPQTIGELNCAQGWVQASEATTDFLHTCGWLGIEDLPPPLPFPDGDACVGIRNGSSFVNWKEYAGACLLGPMRAGVQYRLRFYVGFTQARNSAKTNLALFGTTDCNNLPFGIGIPNFGCPTNDAGWQQLGTVSVEGDKEWQIKEINFTPREHFHAIALGPDCTPGILNPEAYYFLDNLILDEKSDFEFAITSNGTPCTESFTLQVPQFDSLQYQWYKDGIALLQETRPQLKPKQGAGAYVVRVTSPVECKITIPYQLKTPLIQMQLNQVICEGGTVRFGDQMLSESGIYWDTLRTDFNCDSIIELNLRVTKIIGDSLQIKIFDGESFQVGPNHYSRPGYYEIPLQSVAGCDSLVYLDLQLYKVFFPNVFSPNGDGQNDYFTIFGGTELLLVKDLRIFDRWGNIIFYKKDLLPNDASWGGQSNGKPAPTGLYIYVAQLLMTDGKEKQFRGSTLLLR